MRHLLHALILSFAWWLRMVSFWLIELVEWDRNR